MRETGMVIECKGRQHKFLLGLTDDGYRRECPVCSNELLQPREAFSANEIHGMKTIGQAWREKRKAERKSYRDGYYAVVGYVKELETLLLHNGIPLPAMAEDQDLPTRLEGSD